MWLTYLILSTFLASLIHEYSHVGMAQLLVGVDRYSVKPFIHKHEKLGLVGGSVSITYKRARTKSEQAWIAFAPRLTNALFLMLLPFTVGKGSLVIILVATLGCYDMIRGSLPNDSDCKIYCSHWGANPYQVRYYQLTLSYASFLTFLLRLS